MANIPMPAPKPKKKSKKKSSGGIKITNPDKWFSLCVRERANWTCERCLRKFPEEYSLEGLPKAQGLDCSHYFGRSNWSVRFEPFNAHAHCRGCHGIFESDPHYFQEWVKEKIGKECYGILVEKSKNSEHWKQAKKSQNEIAKHYKEEFERMRRVRNNGYDGYLDFQGYF